MYFFQLWIICMRFPRFLFEAAIHRHHTLSIEQPSYHLIIVSYRP